MEKKFIVVFILESGSGNISGLLPENEAMEYYRNFRERLNNSLQNGFIKIFDKEGNDYKAVHEYPEDSNGNYFVRFLPIF